MKKFNQKRYPDWIDSFAQTIYGMIAAHDASSHMPFNGFNFFPFFADLWVAKIGRAVEKFNKSGLAIRDIISFLPTHSSLKFNLFEIIICLKISKTEKYKAREIIDFFLKSILTRAVDKRFWEDNRIIQYNNIGEKIKDNFLTKADRLISAEIAKIVAGSTTLVHGLYNDFCTDYGYDVFGPYDTSGIFENNSSLFIRQFADFKPAGIWEQIVDFPYKKINIYAVYENMESQSCYIGSHTIYKQNVVDSLRYFLLEVDGKKVADIEEIKHIRGIILNKASQFYVYYKKLNFEQQKEKWLWQLCYQFKSFFDKIGVDWQPSPKMLGRVKNKELIDYWSNYNINYEKFCEISGISYLKEVYF